MASVPVNHGGRAAYGYVLHEPERPGEFDPAEAIRLGVPEGAAFGVLQRGGTVRVERPGSTAEVRPEQVMGPARQGRKIVISGDTSPCETLTVAAHRADVLVHEATFAQSEFERARETSHSTARQAAQVALEAEVGLLALTHVSARYLGSELLDEAREVFAATQSPRDFDTIEVPQHERGDARLIRWSERRERDRSTGETPEAVASP